MYGGHVKVFIVYSNEANYIFLELFEYEANKYKFALLVRNEFYKFPILLSIHL